MWGKSTNRESDAVKTQTRGKSALGRRRVQTRGIVDRTSPGQGNRSVESASEAEGAAVAQHEASEPKGYYEARCEGEMSP